MTGGVTFNYDAENRISSRVLNNSTTMYFYDGDGRRVAKVDCPAGMGTFAPTRPL
jgi:YD repeat-containing protein